MLTEWKPPITWVLVLFLMMPISTAFAEDAKLPLHNSDVVKLVKATLPESTIIMTIQASRTAFDVSPDALIRLKNSGVPVKVMEAMVQATNRSAPTPSPAASSGPRAPRARAPYAAPRHLAPRRSEVSWRAH